MRIIVCAFCHDSELFNLKPQGLASGININHIFTHPVLAPHIRQEFTAYALCLIRHGHLPAVVIPVTDTIQPVFFRPWCISVTHEPRKIEPYACCVRCAAVTRNKGFNNGEIIRKLADNVPVYIEHPVNNTLRNDSVALPIPFIKKR